MNLIGILTSVAMAYGSVAILKRDHEQTTMAYKECQSMYVVCWFLFALHVANFLFSLLALCGLEKRICISYVLLALVLFDGIVLVWA